MCGWSHLGATNDDIPTGIAVQNGFVYVSGYFSSLTLTVGTTVLSLQGRSDAFVAKFADTGVRATPVWALKGGGSMDDYATAVAVQGTNVYMAGSFGSPTATFGGTTLQKVGTCSYEAYVTKIIDTGSTASFGWGRTSSGHGGGRSVRLGSERPTSVHWRILGQPNYGLRFGSRPPD